MAAAAAAGKAVTFLFQGLVDFMSQAIQFFYNLSLLLGLPNYGVAIILFTLAIKVVLFPLTRSQLRSMQRMQAIQPKLQELQKKHKNNPQKAQEEMMKMYQKEGINPFSGCWPLLIQMPILYALFTAMRVFFDVNQHPAYVNLEHAGFLWLPNLGVADPLYILPVVAGVATFLQQRASTGNVTEPTQRTMMYIMPVFMFWIAIRFPAGLALYWAVFSLASAGEQLLIRRRGLASRSVEGGG